MCNLNVNIYHVSRVCFFTFLIGVFILPSLATAQTATKAGAPKEAAVPYDIEKKIYTDDKQGCERKAGMFVLLAQKYKAGESLDNMSQMKMSAPLLDKVYERIRLSGLEKATINNMKEYSTCITSAKPHKSQKKERDLTLKHSACVQFNDIILATIDGIKKRKKPETLMMKYEKNSPDMTWTNYAGLPDVSLYVIASLYKASKTQKYGDVVQAASKMSADCYL